jgi:2-oxoglutarate ferredoxin oxidoreductase subunit alpha
MVRCGPGLGGIQTSQGDYYQAVKGGGHGDYRMLVYAPSNVQEAVDITYDAFDKADEYRLPVMILGDAMLGQIMEGVALPEMKDPATFPSKPWATTGTGVGKERRIINSLYINPDELEAINNRIYALYQKMSLKEVMVEEYLTEDAEVIIAAYGSVGRISKSAVNMLREQGIKAGLIRPITLYPFPSYAFEKAIMGGKVKKFIDIELSMGGQMIDDVRLAVNGAVPVEYFGRSGGNVMTDEDIVARIKGGLK